MSAINLSQKTELVNPDDKIEFMTSSGVKENFRLASNCTDAQATSFKTRATPQNTIPDNNGSHFKKNVKSSTDDQLFLRLFEGENLRSFSPYALLTHLKASLSSDGKLLVNVRIKKSGFSLCSKADESATLKEKIPAIT
ncbi:hypothetical protein EPUL_001463 [Erysiphe pulchra]|uniref:Uncharacterized protein n=1 Tax=Erysiphe pulchra TaxID=225359 RepID=A0A2S4PWD8_9PEZI|nr:hypothetical protein EPUL_001463 [Erysiphe pulchra]